MSTPIRPSAPPASQTEQTLVPGSQPRRVFLYHPDFWECSGGEFLPRLNFILAKPGSNGNNPGDRVYPAGGVTAARRNGWQPVPDDLEFVAFGEPQKATATHPSYLDHYASTGGSYWEEAWRRPKVVAGRLTIRVDEEGRRAFQRALMERVGLEVSPEVIEVALQEPLTAARGYLPNADSNPVALARLRQVLAQIPTDHIPPEMRPFLPERPAAPSKKGGRKTS